jgi:hypothetical protein
MKIMFKLKIESQWGIKTYADDEDGDLFPDSLHHTQILRFADLRISSLMAFGQQVCQLSTPSILFVNSYFSSHQRACRKGELGVRVFATYEYHLHLL